MGRGSWGEQGVVSAEAMPLNNCIRVNINSRIEKQSHSISNPFLAVDRYPKNSEVSSGGKKKLF